MIYKIVDIHEQDAFYHDKKNIIGKLFDTDKLRKGNGVPKGFFSVNGVVVNEDKTPSVSCEGVRCFYAVKLIPWRKPNVRKKKKA